MSSVTEALGKMTEVMERVDKRQQDHERQRQDADARRASQRMTPGRVHLTKGPMLHPRNPAPSGPNWYPTWHDCHAGENGETDVIDDGEDEQMEHAAEAEEVSMFDMCDSIDEHDARDHDDRGDNRRRNNRNNVKKVMKHDKINKHGDRGGNGGKPKEFWLDYKGRPKPCGHFLRTGNISHPSKIQISVIVPLRSGKIRMHFHPAVSLENYSNVLHFHCSDTAAPPPDNPALSLRRKTSIVLTARS